MSLGAVLLEVMDKEPTVPGMWIGALVFGGAAVLLARRSVVAALCVTALVVLAAVGRHEELTDPYVGPAIRREAGDAYFVHDYMSTALALALCAGAVGWGIVRRVRTHADERVT